MSHKTVSHPFYLDVEKRYETEVNTYQGKLSKISNELEKDCFKVFHSKTS